jgi:hypothetical protein
MARASSSYGIVARIVFGSAPYPAVPTDIATRLRTMATQRHRLYISGEPAPDFNTLVLGWIAERLKVAEHQSPAAFRTVRQAYDTARAALEHSGMSPADAHSQLLSELTDLMMGDDLSATLVERLSSEPINEQGVRTALAQGFVKNTGENFINLLVYSLADLLEGQDEVLVDKGTPVPLRPYIRMRRRFTDAIGATREIEIPIECDLAIWRRDAPHEAIIVSAKTRLKEVFHIGTMWKLLYDMLADEYCLWKWQLEGPPIPPDMLYVFATADMIRKTGTKTQGPDVERNKVRNLIAMDASFFDYVFVSKTGIEHVSPTINVSRNREALFHELGCIISLVEQRFGIDLA